LYNRSRSAIAGVVEQCPQRLLASLERTLLESLSLHGFIQKSTLGLLDNLQNDGKQAAYSLLNSLPVCPLCTLKLGQSVPLTEDIKLPLTSQFIDILFDNRLTERRFFVRQK
jgi:hypothetical protein